MAACCKSKGYQCKFIDSVNDLFYCKNCGFVAKRVTITGCCGESYCHACVVDIHQQGMPCPECGEENFSILEQLKYQKQIRALRAYCIMKERGCDWSGILEQLDTHLDTCQYVDTKCPLTCHMAIPKHKIEQHVCEECIKRPYVCQHCNFKATYEEVVNTHLPECKYVPLDCPNRCGVSCEREYMGDHIKICRLEDVECSFNKVGCNAAIKRENEEEHAHEHFLQHLTMTAVDCVQMRQELQGRTEEQDKKIKALEKRLQECEKRLQESEKNHKNEQQKLLDRLNSQGVQFTRLLDLFRSSERFRSFEISNYKVLLPTDEKFLKSPIMYTHVGGYKFFVGFQDKACLVNSLALQDKACLVNSLAHLPSTVGSVGRACVAAGISYVCEPNIVSTVGTVVGAVVGAVVDGAVAGVTSSMIGDGVEPVLIRFLKVLLCITRGEYDDELKWPLKASLTIELINKSGGMSKECIIAGTWEKPNTVISGLLVQTSQLKKFAHNDTLYFCVKDIVLHNF